MLKLLYSSPFQFYQLHDILNMDGQAKNTNSRRAIIYELFAIKKKIQYKDIPYYLAFDPKIVQLKVADLIYVEPGGRRFVGHGFQLLCQGF